MLFDSTKIAILLCLFCCFHFMVQASNVNRYRTKNSSSGSSSMRRPKNQKTAATITTTAAANKKLSSTEIVTATSTTEIKEAGSGGNSMIGTKPVSSVFNNLLRSSMDAMERSVDTFQGVSSTVFQTARKNIGNTRESMEKKSGGVSVSSQQKGFGRNISKSMTNMLNTGVTGIEQATDLGLVVAKMGTSKIRSELDGTDGNKEVLNILVKYIASRVGMGTKGSAVQFVDDLGTISTFLADDDDVTRSISTIMQKFMENPKVSVALIRIVLTIMESSPSTSCLLDQMPLKADDLRMLFDVFVGSNGQQMIKILAGLLKDMTTGPDTKAFLQSLLGMMSMFKSDTPAKPGSAPQNPTSVASSLSSIFAMPVGTEDDNEDTLTSPVPLPPVKKKKIQKNSGSAETAQGKKSTPKVQLSQEDDWFGSDENTATVSKSLSKKPLKGVDVLDADGNSIGEKTKSARVKVDETKKSKTSKAISDGVVEKKNKSSSPPSKNHNKPATQPNSAEDDFFTDGDGFDDETGNANIAGIESKTASVDVMKNRR